jgi:hypothetical protein
MTTTAEQWKVEDFRYNAPGREHVPTITNGTDAIAEILPLWHESNDREGERHANAQLVATAPELLAACEVLEARLTKVAHAFYVDGKPAALRKALDGWKEGAELARAAIAKARASD